MEILRFRKVQRRKRELEKINEEGFVRDKWQEEGKDRREEELTK